MQEQAQTKHSFDLHLIICYLTVPFLKFLGLLSLYVVIILYSQHPLLLAPFNGLQSPVPFILVPRHSVPVRRDEEPAGRGPLPVRRPAPASVRRMPGRYGASHGLVSRQESPRLEVPREGAASLFHTTVNSRHFQSAAQVSP
jgi:hypothetical protein